MYRPYRGQRARRNHTLHLALIALLCLFIVACLVFLLFFQSKSSITLFGREIKLPWAYVRQTDEGKAEGDAPKFEIVEGEQGKGEPAPAEPPAPEAPVTPKVIEIPADKVYDAAYIAEVAALAPKGVNTVAFTIKNQAGAVTGVDGIKPSLDTLRAAGMRTIAIFYAYEDDAYATQNAAAAVQNVDRQVWRTGDKKRWLNPASDEANAYLLGNIRACKAAGFDEIVLRSFGWPPAGRLDRIVYGDTAKTGAARADVLVARLNAIAAEAAPTKVSVQLYDPTVAGGLHEPSGQDVAKLYAAAEKVYVPMQVQSATSGDSIRTIVGALTGDNGAKLVPMYTEPSLTPALLAGDKAFYFTGAPAALAQ